MESFSAEWQVLQNQYDSYEKYSLAIKLLAAIFLLCGLVYQLPSIYTAVLIAVLWLQDAIWKTFQARIETRLYVVEAQLAAIKQGDAVVELAFQFNRNFLAQRPSSIGLVKEYLLQALRPTIAYPYLLLLPMALLLPLV